MAKNILTSLGIAAAAAAIGVIQKKMLGSWTATLTTSNEKPNDIMTIVQAIKDSNVLLKRITKTI